MHRTTFVRADIGIELWRILVIVRMAPHCTQIDFKKDSLNSIEQRDPSSRIKINSGRMLEIFGVNLIVSIKNCTKLNYVCYALRFNRIYRFCGQGVSCPAVCGRVRWCCALTTFEPSTFSTDYLTISNMVNINMRFSLLLENTDCYVYST